MALIFLYFSFFLAVHFISRKFTRPGAARLFQLVACFVLLFGFFGFRDITILNDTPHYCSFYSHKAHIASYKHESIFIFHLADRFEYGFQVLIHFLIKYVSEVPFTIIIFSSLVITIGNLWLFNRHTQDIALMCFYMLIASLFFTQYCIIRQSFAIMLFYIAFEHLVKGNAKKYYLFVACASLFHSSAICLFLLPSICRITPSTRNILTAVGGALFVAVNIFVIMKAVGLSDNPYYKIFIQKDSLALNGLADLMQIILLLSVCILTHRWRRVPTPDNHYQWICILTVCVSIMSTTLYPISRVNEYFWPFIIIYLVKLLDKANVSLLKLFIIIVFVSKLIGVNTLRPEWLHIEPYQLYDFDKQYHNYNLYPQKE